MKKRLLATVLAAVMIISGTQIAGATSLSQARSQKNQAVLCVHSKEAREYARILEEDEQVKSFEVGYLLDQDRYTYVNPLDIRKDYFATQWTTDFVLHYADGRIGIRELIGKGGLTKRANVEKLEFSRRYWSSTEAADWKAVIMEKGE